MRIVCDTNILISAFVFPGGSPEQVINLARLREVELCLSPDILTEFQNVLIRKFKYSLIEANSFLDRITLVTKLTYPRQRLDLIKRCKADNRILECAVEAGADFLVTGDKRDILPLGSIGSCRIVTASHFLKL